MSFAARSLLLAAAVAGAVALLATTSVPAEAGVRWGKCGTATHVKGKGAVCSNGFTYNFIVGGAAETWGVKLMTPLNQCAPLTFSVELDGKPVKSTAALAAGKSETVVLGNGLAAGIHVLVVKSQFMYSECFPAQPPQTPGNWGVDALISVQPK
jgi:hypothetical protein